jgi:hypothetical protein
MRFLFRIGFWLAVVLILLPSVGSQTKSNALVSASDALSAAKATVTDARSFCGRQPEACIIGSQAALVLGHRAQAGAKMLHDYLSEHFGADDGGAAVDSGKDKSMTQSSVGTSRDTLAPADRVVIWRGPRSRKEAGRGEF